VYARPLPVRNGDEVPAIAAMSVRLESRTVAQESADLPTRRDVPELDRPMSRAIQRKIRHQFAELPTHVRTLHRTARRDVRQRHRHDQLVAADKDVLLPARHCPARLGRQEAMEQDAQAKKSEEEQRPAKQAASAQGHGGPPQPFQPRIPQLGLQFLLH
jgi:hypothetical protein